jgi:serine/threonine protein kinase
MAEHRGDFGEVCAVKSAELHRAEFLKKEQEILSKVKCSQIVNYQGCEVTVEDGVYLFNLFMEYANKGTVSDAVRGGNGMEEAMVGLYVRQILLGLEYLHSNGIVHCDLKGQNVLLTEQGAKIADFGCARRVEEELVISGTPVFMAPEVARGEEQGFAADVWALGCTMLEMITGKMPWVGVSDPAAVLYRIGFSGDVPEIPDSVSEQGKDFLRKCLKRDPNERLSVIELLEHDFVAEKFKDSALDSETPTTVLEGGFWDWDSLEKTHEVGPTIDHCSSDSSSSSPRDRIQRLCSNEACWEFDDDEEWVTVRNNGEDMNALSFEEMEDNESEIESDIVCEHVDDEISLVIFYEPKIVVEFSTIFYYWCFSSCNCGCFVRDFFSVCQCRKIVLCVKIYSQNKESFIMSGFLHFVLSSIFHEIDNLNNIITVNIVQLVETLHVIYRTEVRKTMVHTLIHLK